MAEASSGRQCNPEPRVFPSGQLIAETAARFGTPVWIYSAETIRRQIDRLRRFDTIRYAQKALSNLEILRLMRTEGVQVDAVSLGELERALAAGYQAGADAEPAEIVYTADVLDRAALARVVELKVPVNAGSPQMLEQIGQVSPGHPVWIRINPGFGHGHSRKTNTGGPHSKHGIWHGQLEEALALVERYHLDLVGLHMHIGSGADYEHLQLVCEAMVSTVERCDCRLRAISAGGGLSVQYQAAEPSVDTDQYFELWDEARRAIEARLSSPVKLEIEPGRFLVAAAGLLVAEVRAHKHVGDNYFVLVDAGFNELVRPAMYGSFHEISVLDADGHPRQGEQRETVIAGPLCEAGDVFTQSAGEVTPRPLPSTRVGDLVVFHDVGAYGSSMSSNYNSRPLAPEVLVRDGDVCMIRRRQTVAEMLALETEL